MDHRPKCKAEIKTLLEENTAKNLNHGFGKDFFKSSQKRNRYKRKS